MRISDWSSDVCSSDLLAQRSKRGVSTARPIQLASVTCMPMAEVEGGACPIPILPFPSIRSLTDVPAEPPRRLMPFLEPRNRSSPVDLARMLKHPESENADRKSTRLNSSH